MAPNNNAKLQAHGPYQASSFACQMKRANENLQEYQKRTHKDKLATIKF